MRNKRSCQFDSTIFKGLNRARGGIVSGDCKYWIRKSLYVGVLKAS